MPQQLLKWLQYGLKETTRQTASIGVFLSMEKEVALYILEHTMGVMIPWHIHYFSQVGRPVGIVGYHILSPLIRHLKVIWTILI